MNKQMDNNDEWLNKGWLKVETTIDDLVEQHDIKRIIGYEDGWVYVEFNETTTQAMYNYDKSFFGLIKKLWDKVK